MKKSLVLFFSFAALCIPFSVGGRNSTDVRRFEFEVGGGMTVGSGYGALKPYPGVNFYAEARVNLKDTPWDLGFQLGLGYMDRRDSYMTSYSVSNKFSMLAFADYNFRYWGKVAPFAGLGLGRTELIYSVPGIDIEGYPVVETETFSPVVLNPRIGVEFFNHLRVTAEYKFHFHKRCNWFALNVGFAFGGGRRR